MDFTPLGFDEDRYFASHDAPFARVGQPEAEEPADELPAWLKELAAAVDAANQQTW